MSEFLRDLEKLSATAPEFHADENEYDDVTRAQIVEQPTHFDYEQPTVSSLKRHAASTTFENDPIYAGRKVNRNAIFKHSFKPKIKPSRLEKKLEEQLEYASNDEESTDLEDEEFNDEDEISEEGDHEKKDLSQSDDNEGLSTTKGLNLDEEKKIAKGQNVALQLKLYENQMAIRMQLQKILSAINSLPINKKDWLHFRQEIGTKENLAAAKSDFLQAIHNLFVLDEKLLEIISKNHKDSKEKDDDDVTSLDEDEADTKNELEQDDSYLSDEEESGGEGNEEESAANSSSTGVHMDNISYKKLNQEIRRHFGLFKPNAYSIAKNWQHKTASLAGRKQKRSQIDIILQIEEAMKDMDRLMSRFHVNRSCIKPWRSTETTDINIDENKELFDDSDFYHLLLKQLIERKQHCFNASTESITLTKHWLQVQQMRDAGEKRRKVTMDRRATKARKIRYEVYKRIINFMPPIDARTEQWTDEAKNELFAALFQ